MRLAKPSKVQVYSFWLSMPFITLAYVYIFYSDIMWSNWKVWAITYPLIYFIGFFSWRTHVLYDDVVTRALPALEQTTKRVILKMLVYVIVMIPSILLIVYMFDHFHIVGYHIHPGDIKSTYLIGLAVDLIFETLWEVVYCIDKYKETVSEREMLEQMNLQQQFDNLKEKVNPHFLFNCFNTLSSLISVDRRQAEMFLDELSKVYRYLLRNNEDGMTTVENEVKFIDSYFKLLKTRYAEGVVLKIKVDESYNGYLLPSLSLQLLVENAVKHNVVNRNTPLMVEIYTTADERLVVTNNLNLKKLKEKSTKVGLKNIKDKYDLLQQDGFEILESRANFSVFLPLLIKTSGHGGSRLNGLAVQ
ncbi:MAG TPA: histidine kinase [Chitinophagaceae bacterium]|nr:histidine kinase [Chitinophagaceae bacterium]